MTRPDEGEAVPTASPDLTGHGFGGQSHGSRKGLGGDPPNAPARRVRPRRATDRTTQAQIADMDSEGGGVDRR